MKREVNLRKEELEFTYSRSSGAGGQNVNKVNSKATLRWNPSRSTSISESAKARFLGKFSGRLTEQGDLVISSDRFRDQGRNAADCMEKLKDMIGEILVAPKMRRATKPTFGSKMRRLNSKREHSEKKKSRSGRITRDES